MNYTTEHYNEDCKIANWVFNRYFKQHIGLKGDMVQMAVIRLWQARTQHDKKKGTYATFACLCAYREMLMFLRKERKHFCNVSLYEKIEDGLFLIDTLRFEENKVFELLETEDLAGKIAAVVWSFGRSGKKIIDLYLKHYSQAEIAARVGVTRPYVTKQIKAFRELLKKELSN